MDNINKFDHHIFIVDATSQLDPQKDTSVRMARSLSNRGHKASFTTLNDLIWSSGSPLPLPNNMKPLKADEKSSENAEHILANISEIDWQQFPSRIVMGNSKTISLASVSHIHVRKEPPFDISYHTLTWMLDSLLLQNPSLRVLNHPQVLRDLNEKASVLRFNKFCKDSLISSNHLELEKFVKNSGPGGAIIKPLDLFGGRGIQRLFDHTPNLVELLKEITDNDKCPHMMQYFDPLIFEGEVRAFYAAGKDIAWCLKKPQEGNFLANTRNGATLHEFSPSKELKRNIDQLSQTLLDMGVFFVGYDIIGEQVTEINITSPRLLTADSNETPYFDRISELIEESN